MMDAYLNTKAHINLKERTIELEGSEGFVSSQLEWLKELILNASAQPESDEGSLDKGIGEALVPPPAPNPPQTPPIDDVGSKYRNFFGLEKDAVDNVIHTEENSFRIITTGIKGNLGEKQIAYALIYCLTKEFYGVTEVLSDEIRELCKANACLDESNFISIFSRGECKKWFIVDGKPHCAKNIKLTNPGKNEAKRLITSLVG